DRRQIFHCVRCLCPCRKACRNTEEQLQLPPLLRAVSISRRFHPTPFKSEQEVFMSRIIKRLLISVLRCSRQPQFLPPPEIRVRRGRRRPLIRKSSASFRRTARPAITPATSGRCR